jgi:hypothetical protein
MVAMVTIKIQNAGQSGHGARTTAGRLVVSFMAKEKEKEGEKAKKKLQKVFSFCGCSVDSSLGPAVELECGPDQTMFLAVPPAMLPSTM